MFASRNSNENTIYQQQRALNTKPIASDSNVLATKTPAINKPLACRAHNAKGNENAVQSNAGKLIGKAEKDSKSEKKDGLEPSFETPGPLRRAPLGDKTTNRKAIDTQALTAKTGGLGFGVSNNARVHRPKLKIHQPDPLGTENDEAEPDIEFMAPRGEPLPDYPDDWPNDREYPQFEGKNLTNRWLLAVLPQCEDEDLPLPDLGKIMRDVRLQNQRMQPEVTGPAGSRAAANALSKTYRRSVQTTAVDSSSKTRHKFANKSSSRLRGDMSSKTSEITNVSRDRRYPIAKVASNTTLGYTKGRTVSTGIRTQLPRRKSQASAREIHTQDARSDGQSIFDEWVKSSKHTDCPKENDFGCSDDEVLSDDQDDEFLREFQLKLAT